MANIMRVGGSSTNLTADGWQPHPDWWDIKKILKDDVQGDYTKRYIYLLSDINNTTELSGGTAYKTSDGKFYTSETVTHTWDRSKDKFCDDGYCTRWVIVYGVNSYINFRKIPEVLYLFLDNCTVTGITFEVTYPDYSKIEAIEYTSNTKWGVTRLQSFGLYRCANLVKFDIPPAFTELSTNSLTGCDSIKTLTIPATLTRMVSNTFNGAKIVKLCIQGALIDLAGDWIQAPDLRSVTVPKEFDSNLPLQGSKALSISSMINLFDNLKNNSGQTAKTITLGSENLAKLTEAEKAIATNKNWILA